jgi:hypothetical protein
MESNRSSRIDKKVIGKIGLIDHFLKYAMRSRRATYIAHA